MVKDKIMDVVELMVWEIFLMVTACHLSSMQSPWPAALKYGSRYFFVPFFSFDLAIE